MLAESGLSITTSTRTSWASSEHVSGNHLGKASILGMFLMGIQEPEPPGGSASLCCEIGSGLRTCWSIKKNPNKPTTPSPHPNSMQNFNFGVVDSGVFRHCERPGKKGKIQIPFLSRRSSLAGCGAGCQHNWLQPGAYVQNPNNSLAAFYIEPNGLQFDFIRAPANNGVAPLAPAPSWK